MSVFEDIFPCRVDMRSQIVLNFVIIFITVFFSPASKKSYRLVSPPPPLPHSLTCSTASYCVALGILILKDSRRLGDVTIACRQRDVSLFCCSILNKLSLYINVCFIYDVDEVCDFNDVYSFPSNGRDFRNNIFL